MPRYASVTMKVARCKNRTPDLTSVALDCRPAVGIWDFEGAAEVGLRSNTRPYPIETMFGPYDYD